MNKRPTQADVARLAGVSRATVSYVINNRTDGNVRISEETRRRVPDVTRAREVLGFETQVSLEEGLRRTLEWFRNGEIVER